MLFDDTLENSENYGEKKHKKKNKKEKTISSAKINTSEIKVLLKKEDKKKVDFSDPQHSLNIGKSRKNRKVLDQAWYSLTKRAAKTITMSMAKKVKREVEKEKTWKDMGWYDRFFVIIDFPFVWIRKLTIPPCEEDEFDNWLVMLWPYVGIPVAAMIILKKFPTTSGWLLYLVPAIIWSAIWYKNNKERNTPPKKGYIWISFVGMVCGFIQTYYVIGALIDLLQMIGIFSKLSATYMGLTIIAVGNALPDAMLTITLAKNE